jgi:branched-chain amino acid aminotransferase
MTADTPERPVVWVNGDRQPPSGPHVSAFDRGLTLADGVFETMRIRDGAPFRLGSHLGRLSRGLAALEIAEPRELPDWVMAAVRAAKPRDAALRVTVTRGVGPAGVVPATERVVRPTTIVAVSDLPLFAPHIYERGLSAHVVSGRRNERAMTAGLKTLSYTDSVAALLEARRSGADEALFLDMADHCSEASASNLFALIGSTLVTPPLTCGALPGITRAALMELAAAQRITVSERPFGIDELVGASEAFLTSSLRGVAPLVRVGAQPLGDGQVGPITRCLMDAYDALVERECLA